MKPETADYLGKARQSLDEAKQIAALMPLHHIVARTAYLAAYHAAEAYIFECTDKTVKTHRGLRTEFSRLARSEPRIDRKFLTFLVQAYEYKSIADYGVGSTVPPITAADAQESIDTAAQMIDRIAELVA